MHPTLIPAAAKYTPTFSDFIAREHARLDDHPTSKLSGVDLKRYEDLDAPENTTPTSDEERPELLQRWNKALKQAYPGANIAAVDYDSSASEVNQLNRIKLLLSAAKQNL